MEFFEIIERRHSVRSFTDEAVSQEDIALILKTALAAPSSRNSHSSSVMVIEDKTLITRIAGMRDYGSAFVEHAPLVILVMGDEQRSDLWMVNASISATFLQLAAEALSLGNCWVHVEGRPHKKDEPNDLSAEEYLRSFLPIPEGRRVLCAIAIGHSAEHEAKPRTETACDDRVIVVK